MVRVLPRVPDGDIPEETAVRPQDVIRPGPHLPSLSDHPPRPPVPTPSGLLWQEVPHQVFHPLRRQRRRDVLRPPIPLRCCEIDVKIARHQQLRAPWLTPYRLADPLHRRSVFRGEVHSHYVPPPRPLSELEPNAVGSKLLHLLHHEVWRKAVEDCDTAAVSARCVRRDDAIAGRPAGVDNISEFGLLEDSHIHVSLGHPPQCCLETSLPSVANVVGAKYNRHLPTCRTPGTVAHAPITFPRFPFPPPLAPASPVYRSLLRVVPAGLLAPFLSPFSSPFYPY